MAVGAAALSGLYVLSLPIVASGLAGVLERTYPPYAGQQLDAVIVLGGYHYSEAERPVSSLLSSTSMVRLSEGMRIQKLNPNANLALSGYKSKDSMSQADAMATVARAYGIAKDMIVTASGPKDTQDEAQHWSAFFQGKKVALVTSATHMPRAMQWFQHYGLPVIAAPTNYESEVAQWTYWRSWLPSASALQLSTKAWHEYLGLLWFSLKTP